MAIKQQLSKKKGGTTSPRLFPQITEYLFASFSTLSKNTARGFRTKSIYTNRHLQMKNSPIIIIIIQKNSVKNNSYGTNSVRKTVEFY